MGLRSETFTNLFDSKAPRIMHFVRCRRKLWKTLFSPNFLIFGWGCAAPLMMYVDDLMLLEPTNVKICLSCLAEIRSIEYQKFPNKNWGKSIWIEECLDHNETIGMIEKTVDWKMNCLTRFQSTKFPNTHFFAAIRIFLFVYPPYYFYFIALNNQTQTSKLIFLFFIFSSCSKNSCRVYFWYESPE